MQGAVLSFLELDMKNVIGLLLVAGLAAPAISAEPVSRDEVRAMVAEMMSDAETRSTLLQGGATSGYDRNFFLASADNKYRLNISGFTQIRYTANYSDSVDEGTGNDYRGGFNLRRTVVGFNGNAGSENLKYSVRLRSLDGGAVQFDDAFVAYELGGGWGIKAGQYKVGFLKEELNSDTTTMAADRSVVNTFFSQGRSQGASLYYLSDNLDASFDFSDGLRGANRATFGANSDSTTNDLLAADYAFSARGEYRFAGTRAQLRDYTSRQDEKFAGNIGAAAHYQGDANNNTRTFDGAGVQTGDLGVSQNLLGYTVDAQIEGGGFGLFASAVGIQAERSLIADATGAGGDFSDFGFLVQGNYRIVPEVDIFARYELINLDSDRGIQENYQFITAGANYYFAGNAAKFTLDGVVGLNHTAGLASGAGSLTGLGGGLNGNEVGITGTSQGVEVGVRAQLQIVF